MEFEVGDDLEYQPGVCNIGPQERKRRLYGGIVAFTFALIAYVVIIILSLPDWTRLLLFFPLFAGFVGLYQYTENFCVAFAAMAKFHMS